VGELCRKHGRPYFVPCTAKAILQLLYLTSIYESRPNFDLLTVPAESVILQENSLKLWLQNRRVTILGRSDIVGMPTFLSLSKLNASVRICHSQSIDIQAAIQEADILIVATGKPQWVNPAWLKPNAIVIDVGIHHKIIENPGNMQKIAQKLVGDVDQSCLDETSSPLCAVTPVPGGVGPMTVVMLLDNVLLAAERSLSN